MKHIMNKNKHVNMILTWKFESKCIILEKCVFEKSGIYTNFIFIKITIVIIRSLKNIDNFLINKR